MAAAVTMHSTSPTSEDVLHHKEAVAAPAWPEKEALLAERRKYIGYNVAVNYSKMPLYIVKGSKQFLYDEVGILRRREETLP